MPAEGKSSVFLETSGDSVLFKSVVDVLASE